MSNSITIYQKEGLRTWLLQQPTKEVVAKLMYVLTPEQMMLLITLHDIKIVEPGSLKLKPIKQHGKKKSKTTKSKTAGNSRTGKAKKSKRSRRK